MSTVAEQTILTAEEGHLRLAGRRYEYAVIRPTLGSLAPPTMLLVRSGVKLYLRPFMGQEAGLYEVVNLGTGHALRDSRFRIVQVFWLGDVFEEVGAGS